MEANIKIINLPSNNKHQIIIYSNYIFNFEIELKDEKKNLDIKIIDIILLNVLLI